MCIAGVFVVICDFKPLESLQSTRSKLHGPDITGMDRVGLNVSLKTNRTNKYAHVPMRHGHAWRTVCSVCAYGARVAHHFLSNS